MQRWSGWIRENWLQIPGLHDGDEWTHFEAARRALSQRLRQLDAGTQIRDWSSAVGIVDRIGSLLAVLSGLVNMTV